MAKKSKRAIRRVTVFCGSSNHCDEAHLTAAADLGTRLAQAGITVVYGGSRQGSMGRLADAALAQKGRVVGVMPRFMLEVEWEHKKITDLRVVETMAERKEIMMREGDAIVVLPGGSGTFEELFEVLTKKRLGQFLGPIVLVDTNGYFDPCITLLERCISERFLNPEHREMWTVVESPAQVLEAMKRAPEWGEDALLLAAVKKGR